MSSSVTAILVGAIMLVTIWLIVLYDEKCQCVFKRQ